MIAVAFPGKPDRQHLASLLQPGMHDLEPNDYSLATIRRSGDSMAHSVQGLESYGEIMRLLMEEKSAIKVFVEVGNP